MTNLRLGPKFYLQNLFNKAQQIITWLLDATFAEKWFEKNLWKFELKVEASRDLWTFPKIIPELHGHMPRELKKNGLRNNMRILIIINGKF